MNPYEKWKSYKQQTRRVIAVLAVAALLVGATAYAFSNYFVATNTFTVGNDFSVGAAFIAYNNLVPTTYTSANACTVGSFPGWTCPSVASTIFASDKITYIVEVETDRTGVTPAYTVTGNGGSFTSFTTSSAYLAIPGPMLSLAGTFTAGLPAMTSGQWYAIQIDITISTGAPSGALSLQLALGK